MEVYNRFDITGMLENPDDSIVFITITNRSENLKITGQNSFKEQAENTATFFSQRKQTIKNIAFDSSVTVSIDYKRIIATDVPDFNLKKVIYLFCLGFLCLFSVTEPLSV